MHLRGDVSRPSSARRCRPQRLAQLASGLLPSLFMLGVSARFVQVASTLAGTRGPVAARAEGSASAVLTASRQVGSALGVAIVSAPRYRHATVSNRTAEAMLVAASFTLVGLLTTRIVPSGSAHPLSLRPEHLFGRHGEGLP